MPSGDHTSDASVKLRKSARSRMQSQSWRSIGSPPPATKMANATAGK